LRILHVGMGWFGEEVGGLARVMTQAVLAQDAAGHQARALVTGSGAVPGLSGRRARAFAPPDAPLPERMKGVRSALSAELSSFDPEVVSFHFALYARPVLGRVAGKRPWMMHFHGPWALEGLAEGAGRFRAFALRRLVEMPVYRSAPVVVALSEAFGGILRREYGVRPERIRIVQGGFDPAPFLAAPDRPRARLQLGLPADRPLAVCVRRLASRMGLENLIDAVGLLRERHPDLLVAVAGKGPLRSELEDRIRQSGLGESVRLLGFVPESDLPALYAAADFSVVPTVALEGFGLIVAESLASGTPVVATRVGALPELLSGFTPELLAEPTAVDVARAMERAMAADVPGREACRAHAARWSWDAVVPGLMDAYRAAGAR